MRWTATSAEKLAANPWFRPDGESKEKASGKQ
jgi:hypothetical protein